VQLGRRAATAWIAGTFAFAMAAIGLAGGSLAFLVMLIGLWGAAHMAAFIACQVGVMVPPSPCR
jgi:hypothetical protein